MPVVSSSELRARLAEALRSAEAGDPVVITRHGKPAAALIDAGQLPRLEAPEAGRAPADGASEQTPEPAGEAPAGGGEPTPKELLERAAVPARRRIAHDLERLPEKLKPVLVTIRDNLFQPGLTAARIKRTLGVGANDLTTRFGAATGATIRKYLDDRRLECASRLLVDTRLDVEAIARLIGHRNREAFARAFQRRHGVRPPLYRASGGRLSRKALETARPEPAPPVPRYMAGVAALASEVPCARCGVVLEPGPVIRVFDHLAPICDACARDQVPELAGLLAPGRAG